MKGKFAVFAVIVFTFLVLILCWIWLQKVITDYDLERALSSHQIQASDYVNREHIK
ncbi:MULTISPECIES: hypothetical protein [Virgibacillus]|uniref:hypothetical protein n=1 Tax=Virgibacillus TaxID=84406 RepID=UPI000953EA11|nr:MULTISPECIES: hypothetical protein [Virgibacillus]MBS7429228.1 hypothetical protein [Virgibacillus sp. 19R1-5]MED3738744.1 hypothetical protein [Virgibacillus pantothenticus]QTY17060.1 hypothetical protein KBP50_03960 [Virgibacillus pantothenticus]SIS91498.1 hypothetical protein SAMN05421787_106198 [Virgibacillus pantothenticus]